MTAQAQSKQDLQELFEQSSRKEGTASKMEMQRLSSCQVNSCVLKGRYLNTVFFWENETSQRTAEFETQVVPTTLATATSTRHAIYDIILGFQRQAE